MLSTLPADCTDSNHRFNELHDVSTHRCVGNPEPTCTGRPVTHDLHTSIRRDDALTLTNWYARYSLRHAEQMY